VTITGKSLAECRLASCNAVQLASSEIFNLFHLSNS